MFEPRLGLVSIAEFSLTPSAVIVYSGSLSPEMPHQECIKLYESEKVITGRSISWWQAIPMSTSEMFKPIQQLSHSKWTV